MSEPAPSLVYVADDQRPDHDHSHLGWPWVALRPIDDHPALRHLIGSFGMILGGSAGMIAGGFVGAVIAFVLQPLAPGLAKLALISLTLSSLAAGAVVGRRVLQRETFE